MLCQENVIVTKRTTPRNCRSLNHKFTVCLSWQGQLHWNKGEIVLTWKMQMEIPRLLAWSTVPTALDSTAISIKPVPVELQAGLWTAPAWLLTFLFLFTKSPDSHRATPVNTQTLSPAIKSRKAWIFIKLYHLPSTQVLDMLKMYSQPLTGPWEFHIWFIPTIYRCTLPTAPHKQIPWLHNWGLGWMTIYIWGTSNLYHRCNASHGTVYLTYSGQGAW